MDCVDKLNRPPLPRSYACQHTCLRLTHPSINTPLALTHANIVKRRKRCLIEQDQQWQRIQPPVFMIAFATETYTLPCVLIMRAGFSHITPPRVEKSSYLCGYSRQMFVLRFDARTTVAVHACAPKGHSKLVSLHNPTLSYSPSS